MQLVNTITYTSKYNYDESAYFDHTKFGTKVSIRDVVKYAIFYSDNSAYMMLLDYIGINNLKNYAKSLGINSYMDTDYFGHVTALDAYLMFNKLNDVINNGGEEKVENANIDCSSGYVVVSILSLILLFI